MYAEVRVAATLMHAAVKISLEFIVIFIRNKVFSGTKVHKFD